MRRFFSFVSGAMVGGLVGATLALLFAPFTGNDLRTRMQGYCQQMGDEMKKAAAERRAQMEAQLAELRSPRP